MSCWILETSWRNDFEAEDCVGTAMDTAEGTVENVFGFAGFCIRRIVGLNCRAGISETIFSETHLMTLLIVLVLCRWVEEWLQETVPVVEE